MAIESVEQKPRQWRSSPFLKAVCLEVMLSSPLLDDDDDDITRPRWRQTRIAKQNEVYRSGRTKRAGRQAVYPRKKYMMIESKRSYAFSVLASVADEMRPSLTFSAWSAACWTAFFFISDRRTRVYASDPASTINTDKPPRPVIGLR